MTAGGGTVGVKVAMGVSLGARVGEAVAGGVSLGAMMAGSVEVAWNVAAGAATGVPQAVNRIVKIKRQVKLMRIEFLRFYLYNSDICPDGLEIN
jgi:hypothetical protein